MDLDTTMSVSLADVHEFITSDKFASFLLENTTDFATAAYILQTLMDAVERDAKSVSTENG